MTSYETRSSCSCASLPATSTECVVRVATERDPSSVISSSAASSSSSVPGASGSGGELAAADVPEGGGVILEDSETVVTQPSAGEFKAFGYKMIEPQTAAA